MNAIWGRGRQPYAVMDAATVVEIVRHLEARGVDVWLDGGWGIDALLAGQTRAHDDLDLIARIEDVPSLIEALGEVGYVTRHGSPPLSFEMTDEAGHQVDVHPVRFQLSGEARYRMVSGEDWVYPPGSLTATGHVAGHDVRCITPEFAMVCHTTGYALDRAHHADVAALSARYGIPIPEYLSAD